MKRFCGADCTDEYRVTELFTGSIKFIGGICLSMALAAKGISRQFSEKEVYKHRIFTRRYQVGSHKLGTINKYGIMTGLK